MTVGDAVQAVKDDSGAIAITNAHTPEKINLPVVKKWEDNTNQDGLRNDNTVIRYELLADGQPTGQTIEITGKADTNTWTNTFTGLDKYKDGKEIVYSVKESVVPTGYTASNNGIGDASNDYTITNTHPTINISIDVTKVWSDDNNRDKVRPEDITLTLKANGQPAKDKDGNVITATPEKVVVDANTWTYTFTNLPKNANGQEIVYTAEEGTIRGYTPSDNGVAKKENEYTITNTHTPEKTAIEVEKVWDDDNNRDNIQPTQITVILKANGTTVEGKQLVLSAANQWKGSFSGLNKYEQGVAINYTVDEVGVSEKYTKSITPEGNATKYTITNKYTPETTTKVVTKVWEDDSNRDRLRPENITLILYANDKATDEPTPVPVKEGNTWTYTYTGLPKNDKGVEIVYTVTEETVPNYIGDPVGLTITNTHGVDTIDIRGEKFWIDANNQDGIRPPSIKVQLKADGEVVETKTVTAENANEAGNWEYSFTKLPKYRALPEGTDPNGEVGEPEEIVYTIDEVKEGAITGTDQKGEYAVEIDGYNIKNTHSPSKKSISGTKTWDDADNQDGARPDSIKVQLLADGEVIKTVEVTEEDDWSWTFEELPEYKNGNLIDYKIDEEDVEGYSKKVETYDITNTHKPATVEISGTKTWDDADDQDGQRPESITVNLLADGEKVDSATVTPDEEGNWTYTFTATKYKVGEVGHEIVYTVTEENVEGYETEIPEGEYNITNKHTPETVTYIITKEWDDENNNDGIRPDSIKVKLLADGEVVKVVTVKPDENGEWKYTFGPLDKNKAGKPINYTIEEEPVAGYKVTITDPVTENKTISQVLKNTHTPEKININGKKTWVDENNKAGKRPENITVYVYADKKLIATLVVSADSDWEYEVKNLYKFNNGKKITYSIEELPVEDYETEIEGFNITNIITDTQGEEIPPDTYVDKDVFYIANYIFILVGTLVGVATRRRVRIQ